MVLRFWNNDVLGNMEAVFEAIKKNTYDDTRPLIPSHRGRVK